MARKLNTTVHVTDENGIAHVFGPDDEVPGWAEEKITNPDVWADEGEGPGDVRRGDPGNSGFVSETEDLSGPLTSDVEPVEDPGRQQARLARIAPESQPQPVSSAQAPAEEQQARRARRPGQRDDQADRSE